MSVPSLSANHPVANKPQVVKKIKVGVFQSPPMIILEDNEEPKGFVIDFITAIAERENWQVEWVRDTWANLLERSKRKELDLMTFIAYREDRAQYLNYSEENFITGWGQVYTHSSNLFQSVLDFDGKKVAILKNEIHGIGFKELCKTFDVQCNTVEVGDFNQAFGMLQNKEVDGTVAGNWVGHDYLSNYDIVPTTVIYNPRKSLFAVPKGKSTEILSIIDQYIVLWKDDTSSPYYAAHEKWLTEEHNNIAPKWLSTALLIISGLLAISALITYILRQQIKRQTASLIRQSEQTRQIIDLIPHFIYAANDEGNIFLMNRYAAEFFGLKLDDYDLLPKSRLIEKYGASTTLFEGDTALLEHGDGIHRSEFKTINAHGDEVHFNLIKVPFVSSSTEKPSVVAVGVDVTASKNYEKQIEHMSYHDPLTQLPNRILLNDRLKQSLALSVRQGYSGAVLLIDLDDFKTINHKHGAQIGDQLLQELAERISSLIKVGDTVARLSSDTFVVLLHELSETTNDGNNKAFKVAKMVQEAINRPINIKGSRIHVTASIGIVVYPADGKSHTNIIPRAETAMRHAKRNDKSSIVRFTSEMETAVFQKHLISNELKNAIENNEFELYYQPQFHISSVSPIGFEALLRWNHSKHGIIYPNDFIPAAEENNLILPIGYWVIEQSFRQLKKWQSTSLEDAFLGINLSVVQIKDPNLVSLVKSLIQQYDINPNQVEFEITETVLLQDIKDSLATLNALKKLGVKLSIDDFGTGYSSLSYINQLPLDKLKIDRSFIKDIEKDRGSQAIVKTIVNMSDDLGLSVLAEGIEERAHVEYLNSIGCKYYQGYYFSKPITANEVLNIYSSQQAPIQNKLLDKKSIV
ncbi:MAG: EAL domain-containing protein [Gammaproteobacteria bacterium]|nr:EAL domain-containing protein [Gammaproteobacteria bacterium]